MLEYWKTVLSLLDELNLKKADIAKELGVSRSVVHNWIKLDRYPRADQAQKIAAMVNAPESFLMGETYPYQVDIDIQCRFNHDFAMIIGLMTKLPSTQYNKLIRILDRFYFQVATEVNKKVEEDRINFDEINFLEKYLEIYDTEIFNQEDDDT